MSDNTTSPITLAVTINTAPIAVAVATINRQKIPIAVQQGDGAITPMNCGRQGRERQHAPLSPNPSYVSDLLLLCEQVASGIVSLTRTATESCKAHRIEP